MLLVRESVLLLFCCCRMVSLTSFYRLPWQPQTPALWGWFTLATYAMFYEHASCRLCICLKVFKNVSCLFNVCLRFVYFVITVPWFWRKQLTASTAIASHDIFIPESSLSQSHFTALPFETTHPLNREIADTQREHVHTKITQIFLHGAANV